jgi:hypothetical protein
MTTTTEPAKEGSLLDNSHGIPSLNNKRPIPENDNGSQDRQVKNMRSSNYYNLLRIDQQARSNDGNTGISVSSENSPAEAMADLGIKKALGEKEELVDSGSHKVCDEALAKSCDLIKELDKLLKNPENKFLSSEEHRKEWISEIASSLKKTVPETIIGCLGGSGVGKSSLLNALLDEAAVLPTSGSRGCTAAVVELRFNQSLCKVAESSSVAVYVGHVEFMSLQEWREELKLLIDECCTPETQTINTRHPDERRQSDAAAAWTKIDQVYGSGTMRSLSGKTKTQAWDRLSRDDSVVQLLTPPAGATSNTSVVKEGNADAAQAKLLTKPLSDMKGKLKRSQKKWAKSFRVSLQHLLLLSWSYIFAVREIC